MTAIAPHTSRAIVTSAGYSSSGFFSAKPLGDHIALTAPPDFGRAMLAESREWTRMLGLNPKPAWAEVWHLWKVIIPRRSITGALLMGQVANTTGDESCREARRRVLRPASVTFR
jgi:hypothetical protein